ncbi:MAG TPA: MBL fold metallo-hydrolase, partial [Polyangia bacterium]|nr:MBL fold metallo-hydrolase [Polyangia bacterium]
VAYLSGFSNAVTVDTGMGLLLVDTKMDAPLLHPSANLHDLLARRGEHVRWIAVTHPHRDHLAGLGNFAADGDLEEIWGAPLDGALPLPGATKLAAVAAPQTRWVGETEVRLIPFAHAHTGGDLVVWLPGSRVAITGDIVTCGYEPHAELEQGGSYQGLLRAARAIQALRPAWVVGGHGDVCSGAELDAYVTHIAQEIDGPPPPPAPYREMGVPFRVISSQEKVLRCAALERREGGWARDPTIDPRTPYLDVKPRHCP